MFRLCSRSVFGRSEWGNLSFVPLCAREKRVSLLCMFGHGEAVNIMSKTFEYLQISLLKYLEMHLMCSGLGGEEFLRGVCLGRGAVGAVNIMNKGSIPPPAGTTTTMYQS